MKNTLLFSLFTCTLLLSGCSNEDWNRIDQRFSKVSFDVISEPDPYADQPQYDENEEDDEEKQDKNNR